MWIGRNMAPGSDTVSISAGKVHRGSQGRVAASANSGRSQYSLVVPGGLFYVPDTGEEAVIVETDAGPVCIGVRSGDYNQKLGQGEIMLRSSRNSSSVWLTNDGKIVIEGDIYISGRIFIDGEEITNGLEA